MKIVGFYPLLFLPLLFIFLSFGCSDFQKLLNSNDSAQQYKEAESYYDAGDYPKATKLFEQVAPKYRGRPQAERVIFLYADSYYNNGDYYLAANQFESFIQSFPRSVKIEEAYFKEAMSYYHLSPKFSLDQEDTNTAIEKLQLFINNFPSSEYSVRANLSIQELQIKLERKEFEIAKNFYTIQDYAAAIKSLENFIAMSPGNNFREEALYYKFLATYTIAMNSVESKKQERLSQLITEYNTLISAYPESIFLGDINDKIAVAKTELSTYQEIGK